MALTKMTLAGAAILLTATSLTTAATAQTQYRSQGNSEYDGYCYVKKGSNTTGTVVGAVAGGALGSQVSKNEKGLGTIAGAVLGGVIGNQVGKTNDTCMNGEYYSYQSGSYSPAYAPDGYNIVYYKSRPDSKMYDVVYYDAQRHTSPAYSYNNSANQGGYYNESRNDSDRPYNNGSAYNDSRNRTEGWRDTAGAWHTDKPVAFGWKDSRGRWHEGQLQTYGYKDRNGNWHETGAQAYGYNDR
ncbi:MAG: glycine zipper 2TM domain-containing protein [Asticcacaulis sp.]